MKVCVIAKFCQKVRESFYKIYFENHRVSIGHLGGVLAYADIYGPMSMGYRFGKTDFQCGYRHKHIYIYGCLLTSFLT